MLKRILASPLQSGRSPGISVGQHWKTQQNKIYASHYSSSLIDNLIMYPYDPEVFCPSVFFWNSTKVDTFFKLSLISFQTSTVCRRLSGFSSCFVSHQTVPVKSHSKMCFVVSPPGGTAGFGPPLCLSDPLTGALQGPYWDRWDSQWDLSSYWSLGHVTRGAEGLSMTLVITSLHHRLLVLHVANQH